jgi:hypothetical protein
VDLAAAANLNVAAPIEAAASANVLSSGAEAVGVAQQHGTIAQTDSGTATADAPQHAQVDQSAAGATSGGHTTGGTTPTRLPARAVRPPRRAVSVVRSAVPEQQLAARPTLPVEPWKAQAAPPAGSSTARPAQLTAPPVPRMAQPAQWTAPPVPWMAQPAQSTAQRAQWTARPVQSAALSTA